MLCGIISINWLFRVGYSLSKYNTPFDFKCVCANLVLKKINKRDSLLIPRHNGRYIKKGNFCGHYCHLGNAEMLQLKVTVYCMLMGVTQYKKYPLIAIVISVLQHSLFEFPHVPITRCSKIYYFWAKIIILRSSTLFNATIWKCMYPLKNCETIEKL